MPAEHQVMVVGQIARDIVLQVDSIPAAGSAAPATQRLEMLGGKGANQALGLVQLGLRVSLLSVVGGRSSRRVATGPGGRGRHRHHLGSPAARCGKRAHRQCGRPGRLAVRRKPPRAGANQPR